MYLHLPKAVSFYTKPQVWQAVLLVVRIWLCYRLTAASYSSVTGILTSQAERDFFKHWFGDELHFPAPVFMAFLAKSTEFFGGIFLLIGLFTKPAALLVAFTMLVATLTANLGENFIIDGGFTISYFLFAVILMVQGSGTYSLDHVRRRRKQTMPVPV